MVRRSKEEVCGAWRRRLERKQEAVLETLADMPGRVYEALRKEGDISDALHAEYLKFVPELGTDLGTEVTGE